MAFYQETGGAWSIMEDVLLYRVPPVRKAHCQVGGNFSTKSWGNGEMPSQKR
ncbi:unnamed protein product [Prunus brigantina]